MKEKLKPAQAAKMIFIMWNSKGGCGKTLAATGLFEGLEQLGHKPVVFNCDPQNSKQSVSSYAALEARDITILSNNKIYREGFDQLFREILNQDQPVLIDLGGNLSHSVFTDYCKEMGMIDTFISEGFIVCFNVLIDAMAGVQQSREAVNSITNNFAGAQIFLWMNLHNSVQTPGQEHLSFLDDDGVHILDSKEITLAKNQIVGHAFLNKFDSMYQTAQAIAMQKCILSREATLNPGLHGFDFITARRIANWKKEFIDGAKLQYQLLTKPKDNHE